VIDRLLRRSDQEVLTDPGHEVERTRVETVFSSWRECKLTPSQSV
jgi:hypothetical protein